MANKSTHILLIEDNPADVVLVHKQLESASMQFEFFSAESLVDARQVLENRNIDIILLDLGLPDATGFATLSQVLKKHPSYPIVVLTSVNNEIVGNQAVKAGAQDYLVKGQFDGKQLGRAIRYALQRYDDKSRAEIVAQKVKKEKESFEVVHAMAKFGNWSMDLINRKMIWADPVFQTFGFQPNSFEPTLSDYLRYVHNEDKSDVESFFEDVPNKLGSQSIEHRIVVEGRKVRYLNVTARLQQDEVGNISVVGGLQDITERKTQEMQVVEELMARKAPALKDELLADMSFHVRTPLSSVVQLTFLLSQITLSNNQRELVDDLRKAVDDLTISFNNLLNFSLLVSDNSGPTIEVFYLPDLLQSVQQIANIRANSFGVQLNFPVSTQLPDRIKADQKKITQILYNLIEFGLEKETLGLICAIGTEVKPVGSQQQAALVLSLTTNAESISSVKLKELISITQLMDKFKTDQDHKDKRFLPLAIVALLAERLGGRFDLQGRGSLKGNIISVRLPIEIVVPTDTNAPGQTINKPLRVLLVEDHYLNQIATRKILTAWSDKVTVDIAENGLIGVEKFRSNAYDLVLMDIQMPVMNGFEATSRIRTNNTEVPIIALTANASRQEADRCKEFGLNAYLAKPFKPQDLFEKILQLI